MTKIILWSFCLVNAGGLVMALLFSLPSQAFFRTSGKITGFNLTSCGVKNCLSIESGKAFTGMIPSNFAFDSAFISIVDKKTKKTLKVQAEDIFFDSMSDKIFIRKMTEHKNAEAIYDLKTEKLSIYFVRPRS
jgi:hypothetical protein